MKRRGNANLWLLGILIAIIGGISIDIARKMATPAVSVNSEYAKVEHSPPFHIGTVAPDFTLPDDHGQHRRFSDLVKRDTIVTFTCGCNSCKEMHTYLAKLVKKMGSHAPAVVTVTSMPPDGEAAWIRDTQLKQTFLFQPHEGPEFEAMKKQLQGKPANNVIDLYKGHPCPRVYRVNGRREVTYIGPSAAEFPQPSGMEAMAYDVAKGLDFSPPGEKYPGKLEAPPVGLNAIRHLLPPGSVPQKTAAAGGSGSSPAH